MIPKHKQIPNYYIVVYAVSAINTLFFFFSVLYFDLYRFYWNIGIGSNVIIILGIIFYFIFKSSNFITKNLESDKLNIKSLRCSIIIHLVISIALIFGVVMPYFEVEINLTNKILNILTNVIPSIASKSLDYISKFTSGFLSFLVSTIIVVFQGTLGAIFYDYIIKPRLKRKKQPKKNSEK